MWTRKELKTKSKIRFQANYWKSVLVALVLMLVIGTLGGGSVLTEKFSGNGNSETQDSEESIAYDMGYSMGHSMGDAVTEKNDVVGDAVVMAIFVIILVIAIIVVGIIIIPLQVFVFNPLEIGCKRFFLKNLKEDAQAREMCYAFDNGYKSNVKTMFFRDLYTFLWMLLLIIPGIIKAYEYQMIPYILAENPGMDKKEAFALSKKMMYGNKWKSFVLDLSFLGWNILNILTLGVPGIFYVSPYECQTEAALYEAIKNQ